MTISSWLNFGGPAPPGRGFAVGRTFLGPSYVQRAVFASLWALFFIWSAFYPQISVTLWQHPHTLFHFTCPGTNSGTDDACEHPSGICLAKLWISHQQSIFVTWDIVVSQSVLQGHSTATDSVCASGNQLPVLVLSNSKRSSLSAPNIETTARKTLHIFHVLPSQATTS